jgi:peroxiredoxin
MAQTRHEPSEVARYQDVLQRMMSGEPVADEEFEHHFELQNRGATDGPAVGSIAPPVDLQDQTGLRRSFDDLVGERGLLLVFIRSAHWCSYCRNQLGELNLAAARLNATGVRIASVSPDSVVRLREFWDNNRVTFPMLSDPDGDVIKAYGLLNSEIPEGGRVQGSNIPFPGQLLLGPDRTVLAKEFTGDLRHRPSGAMLVGRHLDAPADGAHAELSTSVCRVEAALSSPRAFGGQEIGLRFDVDVADGWHVYGAGAPSNYQAFDVRLDDELVESVQLHAPEPTVVELPGLGETVPVHEGRFTAHATVRLRWRPAASIDTFNGLESFKALRIPAGGKVLRGSVALQACSDTECMPPSALPFELPFTLEEDIPTAQGRPFKWSDMEERPASS